MSLTTCFSAHEDELLQGLPLEAQLIYLRGLRRYMNYQTGIVGGRERRISYLMLCELLEVHPHQGVKGSRPDKSKVRRLLGWLERVGLAARQEDNEGYLVFYLPVAKKDVHQDADSSVYKKADTKPTPSRHGSKLSHNAGSGTGGDIPKTAKADTHLISDISKTTTTTTNEDTEITKEVCGGELIFPSGLNPQQKHGISKQLARCPIHSQQIILDELAGWKTKKDIPNPVGYVRTLADLVCEGIFIPEAGIAVAENRELRKNDFQVPRKRSSSNPDDPEKAKKIALISQKMKEAAVAKDFDFTLYNSLGQELSRLNS